MKTFRQFISSTRGYDRLRAIVAALVAGVIAVLGAPPAWWADRGVTNSNPADDYAPLNQGQFKNLVRAAVLELDANLAIGAGATLHELVAAWAAPTAQTDDFAAVNIGQLKAAAAPIYDRLIFSGATSGYPWDGPGKVPDDYALANIGQAKHLFAFNAKTADYDRDGIPDWWEIEYLLDPFLQGDADEDADGDGWSNKQEWLTGANPVDSSSGPSFPAAQVVGDGDQGERISKQVTVTLPAGSQTYIVIVAVQTAEYPDYTSNQSEYNDLADWRISPTGATALQGSAHVNALHGAIEQSKLAGTSFLGLAPYAIAANGIVRANPSSATQVQIEVGATNISDGALATTVVAALLPVEFQTTDITKGFDYPLQDDPPDAYTVGMTPPIIKDQNNPEWWTSVARTDASGRGLNVNHHVKLVFGSVAAANLCEIRASDSSLLYVDGDGVGATGNLTKAETLLTLTGRNSATAPGIQAVDVQVRTKDSSHQVLLTLKVLVMPERKVRLRVHFVEDHTTNIGAPLGPPHYLSEVPDTYKDVAAIVQKLNEVYRQNCLTFVADAGSGTLDVKGWDVSAGELTSSGLSIFRTKFTPEAGALHILVFRRINTGPGVLGYWDKDFRPNCMFVGAKNHEERPAPPPQPPQPIPPAQVKPLFLLTCAHENGHALQLSTRHSKDTLNRILTHDDGVFPLRYNNMHSLMQAEGDPAHPEHTWLRHEEWHPAWIEAGKYLLP